MPTPPSIVFPPLVSTTDAISTPPTTTIPTPSANYAYPIPTGTWTITGGLALTTGTCISDPTRNNYKEVWYCAENQTEIIVIKDYSTDTKYSYYLDMDSPTRVRGVQGTPPTGSNTDDNKSPFWTFSVPYTRQASFTTGDNCEVNVDLVFLLGKTQSVAAFYE